MKATVFLFTLVFATFDFASADPSDFNCSIRVNYNLVENIGQEAKVKLGESIMQKIIDEPTLRITGSREGKLWIQYQSNKSLTQCQQEAKTHCEIRDVTISSKTVLVKERKELVKKFFCARGAELSEKSVDEEIRAVAADRKARDLVRQRRNRVAN